MSSYSRFARATAPIYLGHVKLVLAGSAQVRKPYERPIWASRPLPNGRRRSLDADRRGRRHASSQRWRFLDGVRRLLRGYLIADRVGIRITPTKSHAGLRQVLHPAPDGHCKIRNSQAIKVAQDRRVPDQQRGNRNRKATTTSRRAGFEKNYKMADDQGQIRC